MTLPTDAQARKNVPLYSGLIKYFPDALIAVAELSKAGNEQHNPGKPLHWDRSKSGDELDALTRHLFEAGTKDTDNIRHSAKAAWRALANLQKEIEGEVPKVGADAQGDSTAVLHDSGWWIMHHGNLAPKVPPSTKLEVELRDGTRFTCRAASPTWEKNNGNGDIVKWRLAK